MNPFTAEQIRRNTASRDRWQGYAAHRREVTSRLLAQAKTGDGRLCVLGAGNSNDLDLGDLTGAFAEVHLVDIDAAALAAGLERQPAARRERARLHGGVDLTGVWDSLAGWSPQSPPTDVELDRCLELLKAGAGPALPAEFDAVASACVLSQLIEAAVLALGSGHARLLELVLALRAAHLGLLARLLVPGGKGLLVTDFVSSETVPNLARIAPGELPAALAREIDAGNFFHGLNPFALRAFCCTDAELSRVLTGVTLSGPWLWIQRRRSYAVCAVGFERLTSGERRVSQS